MDVRCTMTVLEFCSGAQQRLNAMRYGITESLFKFNDDMSTEPWLAKSYTVNDEHTEWVITLRDDICFSDGCPVTPSKVKECFEYLKEVSEGLRRMQKST